MLVIWYVDTGNTSHPTFSVILFFPRRQYQPALSGPCPEPIQTLWKRKKARKFSDVDPKNQPCKCRKRARDALLRDSALALLVAGIGVADHPHHPVSTHDLAIPADLLD
jgi:hypothetical protein